MSKRKVVERYITWAALKPQLKGVRAGATKPQLACVHIGEDRVTIDAVALRDWVHVVEGAKFSIGVSDTLGWGKSHCLSARTVDGPVISAHFYRKTAAVMSRTDTWEVDFENPS